MSNFFNCTNTRQNLKNCPFREIGNCFDYVSDEICNGHLKMFNLENRADSLTDGNNTTTTRIHTYYNSLQNIQIPLFVDSKGRVNTNQIYQFCKSIEQRFGTNSEKLYNVIACLNGISAFIEPLNSYNRSWLDEPTTTVDFFYGPTFTDFPSLTKLPKLHRIILAHTYPSITINKKTDEPTNLLPNLVYTYDQASDSFNLTLTNKEMVLKLTEANNSLATPLVLSAKREINPDNNQQCFTKMIPSYT